MFKQKIAARIKITSLVLVILLSTLGLPLLSPMPAYAYTTHYFVKKQALASSLWQPKQIVRKGMANYIVEYGAVYVSRVPDGTYYQEVVAGRRGHGGHSPDGSVAVDATLTGPTSIDIDNDGSVYITETNDHRVRVVRPDGKLYTVAGNGLTSPTREDAADATQTAFNSPSFVKVGPDGLVYIVDDATIRRIEADGSTTRILGIFGDQNQNPYVEGGVAKDHAAPGVQRIAFHPDGRLFFTSGGNIYYIDNDQTVHNFSASPGDRYSHTLEDRALANKSFGSITGFEIDAEGTIWIGVTDGGNSAHYFFGENGEIYPNLSSVQYIKAGVVRTAVGGGTITDATTHAYGHEILLGSVVGITLGENGNVFFLNHDVVFNPYSRDSGTYIGRLSTNTDVTPPIVNPVTSIPANENGWFNQPVTLSWDITDPESAIISTRDCETPTIDSDIPFSYSTWECDAISNGGIAGTYIDIKIDLAAPAIQTMSFSQNPKSTSQESLLTVTASEPRMGCGIGGGEYFIGDADPGIGNGTPLVLVESTDTGNGTLTAAFGTDLSVGVHKITVRVQDCAGNWSTALFDYLVVQGDSGAKKITGKRSVVPSLNNGDILPGLIDPSQTDAAIFGFTVERDAAGIVNNRSDFQISYETGVQCHKPAQAVNCHSFELNSTAIAQLSTQGTNNSTGVFTGQGVLTINGSSTDVTFVVTGTDGDLLNPTASDQFQLKIYPLGAPPATTSPDYIIHFTPLERGSIMIR